MEDNSRIIIIPDVHGRNFWKEAVKGQEGRRIIFLGDYLDPYPQEDIPQASGFKTLREVIAFKKEYPGTVTLLLGNHDLGYLDRTVCECRMDYFNERSIHNEIVSNIDLFDLVHVENTRMGRYLFSHAGLNSNWVAARFGKEAGRDFNPEVLNDMLHNEDTKHLFDILSDVSIIRGGNHFFGSPVWEDAGGYRDDDDLFPGYTHIFGHTQMKDKKTLFNGRGFCLDCRRAFELDIETGGLK